MVGVEEGSPTRAGPENNPSSDTEEEAVCWQRPELTAKTL